MKRYFTLIFSILLLQSAFAQKRVIIEKFTSAFCGSCPNGALVIKDLQAQYPGTIWVNHHKPTWWTDYQLQNEQSDILWDELSVPGTPSAMVDRTPVGNALIVFQNNWENLVAAQSNAEYFANLSVENVTFDLENRTFHFDLSANFESLPPAGDFRLTAMILEDSVTGTEQHSYYNDVPGHPLEGLGDIMWDYSHQNVTRAILDDAWGTADVIPSTPELGMTYSQNFSYMVPEAYNPEQIKVVGLLAYHDENNFNNRQVLNATEAKMSDFGLILTSTNEIETFASNIRLSPNPTSDWLNLSLDFTPDQIFILNAQGQVVKQIASENYQAPINISQLEQGIYFLQLKIEGKSVHKKFMVID